MRWCRKCWCIKSESSSVISRNLGARFSCGTASERDLRLPRVFMHRCITAKIRRQILQYHMMHLHDGFFLSRVVLSVMPMSQCHPVKYCCSKLSLWYKFNTSKSQPFFLCLIGQRFSPQSTSNGSSNNEPFSTAERSERVENFLFRATREYTEAGIEQAIVAMRRLGANSPEPRKRAVHEWHVSTQKTGSYITERSRLPGLIVGPYPSEESLCCPACPPALPCFRRVSAPSL